MKQQCKCGSKMQQHVPWALQMRHLLIEAGLELRLGLPYSVQGTLEAWCKQQARSMRSMQQAVQQGSRRQRSTRTLCCRRRRCWRVM